MTNMYFLLTQIHILQHTHTNIGSSTLRDSSVLLIDLSLNASEQQLYASSLYYRTNVRRGNTLVKI